MATDKMREFLRLHRVLMSARARQERARQTGSQHTLKRAAALEAAAEARFMSLVRGELRTYSDRT